MYTYHHPKPIIVKLTDDLGFQLRQKAARYIAANQNRTGAERGSSEEQGFGVLAEMVIRNKLGMPEINLEDHPLGYDLLLPAGVKVDVKCRGGALAFKEEYESSDGIAREAKHNFFARQIYDKNLDADMYMMIHLETPSKKRAAGYAQAKKMGTVYLRLGIKKTSGERRSLSATGFADRTGKNVVYLSRAGN